jgi:hypothetical protein
VSTASILGMPVTTDCNVPIGKFLIVDRRIHTSMTLDQLMVKLWVGDALKKARTHLAGLVEAVELRLFGEGVTHG